MDMKRKPELHLVGCENNKNYNTLCDLYLGRDLFITCHCIKPRERVDLREMAFTMRTAEIVLVFVGNKAEYRALRSIVYRMPEKCLFIFEDFAGRECCLCKAHKALLIEGKHRTVDVVSELISIAMYDSTMMLDYQDFFACSGWRTIVNYRKFSDGDDAYAGMEREFSILKDDETKEVSLLFAEGDFSLLELLDITKLVSNEDESNPLVGCSYEEEGVFGLLWFVRDKNEPTEREEKWRNPFKTDLLKWYKIGFLVMLIISIILGVKLLRMDSAEGQREKNHEGDKPALMIITVKTAIPDVSGLGIVSCHRDVVKLYGEEFEAVSELIEDEFSVSGMDKELELLSLFDRAFSESELTCRRIDGEVISFLQEGNYHLDGVGGTVKDGYTYSVKDGKLLSIDDILVDEKRDEFYQVIGRHIVEALSVHPDVVEFHVNVEEEYQEKYGKYNNLSAGWYLGEDGICFLFEEGDFGPMVIPPIEVTVPFTKIGSFVREEFD